MRVVARSPASSTGSPVATGNAFFDTIVGGTVHVLDPRDVYAGGANRPVVMVELKLPNIGLATVEARAEFIAAATDIAADLAIPGQVAFSD